MTRFRHLAFTAALVAGLTSSQVAHADEEEPLPPAPATTTTTAGASVDTIHLRNGGMFRGHVSEIVPGDHVTIRTETGETKRLAWAEIDRVIVASTPIPPPPSGVPGVAPATAPLDAPMVGPRAHVHIKSPRNVILYRKPAGTNAWSKACTSPCNTELPIGDSYRVAGNGVQQSKEFHLEASPGSTVEVVVDPQSTGGMILGGFIAGGGFTVGYVGLIAAAVGAARADGECGRYETCSESDREDGKKIRDAGLIALGVGAAATVVGLIVFLNNATTDISQHSASKSDAKSDRPVDAFLRQPTWRTARSSSEVASGGASASFPLMFTARF